MTDGPIPQDGSPSQDAPATERPFTHPLAAYQQATTDEEGNPVVDPRQELIERMAEQNNEERTPPGEAVLNGVVPEVDGRAVADLSEEELAEMQAAAPQLDEEEGVTRRPLHPEPSTPGLPAEYADDPLAEFIVMQGEEAFFRTVVEGQEQLIPLDKARRELQKRVAGDIRLEQNALWQKQLEEREEALRINELTFQQRATQQSQASPPSEQDVDDVDLTAQAREVVSGLFTGTEEEAAEKLADLLKEAQGARNATPNVDPGEIARQAATAARQQIAQEELDRDVKKGFKQFQDDYPEIAQDDNLFRYADGMTDTIAAEHPDWMPSEVMLEAGKRTREWLNRIAGGPEQTEEAQNNDRQERKRNLRPLPRARSDTPPAEEQEPEATPGDYIAELRKQRGQVA